MGRRQYTTEFKKEAVRLMLIDGSSAQEVAGRLGVSVGVQYQWKRKHLGELEADQPESGAPSPKAMAGEIAELRRRLAKTERTRGGSVPQGLVNHSDRGSTYASDGYQRRLAAHGMRPSMSRKANCHDNAAMESFYGRYKSSSVRGRLFPGEAEARANAFENIEMFYNRFR